MKVVCLTGKAFDMIQQNLDTIHTKQKNAYLAI